MPLFNVIVHEINSITLKVEAEDDIEAGRLVEQNINNYEVLDEEVIDWNVDFVEEVSNSDTSYSDCVDKLVESMGQSKTNLGTINGTN